MALCFLRPESMMRELRLLGLFAVISAGGCFSQTLNDSSPQSATSPSIAVDCSDPSQAGSAECNAAQTQTPGRENLPSSERVPQLKTPYNQGQTFPRTTPLNPSQVRQPK